MAHGASAGPAKMHTQLRSCFASRCAVSVLAACIGRYVHTAWLSNVPGGGIMARPSAAVSAACSSCTCPRLKVPCIEAEGQLAGALAGVWHTRLSRIYRHTCSRSTRAPVITITRHVASDSAACRHCTCWPPAAAKLPRRHRDLSSCRLALPFVIVAAGVPPEWGRLSSPPAAGC